MNISESFQELLKVKSSDLPDMFLERSGTMLNFPELYIQNRLLLVERHFQPFSSKTASYEVTKLVRIIPRFRIDSNRYNTSS
jgi:hypothetical protein